MRSGFGQFKDATPEYRPPVERTGLGFSPSSGERDYRYRHHGMEVAR